MESQQTQCELPFQRRDEFDQELYRRPLSSNARSFLQVMYRAANGAPDRGCDGGIVRGTQFWLTAEQDLIADLIGISTKLKKDSREKAVRRTIEELESLQILKRRKFVDVEDGHNVQKLYYVLSLVRLIDLPEVDMNTTRGRIVADMLSDDPFEDDESTPSEPVSGHLSGHLSGGSSGRSSGALSGRLSGPHGHGHGLGHVTHDQTKPMESMDHGHGVEIQFSESIWRDLTDDQVRQLARSPDLKLLREMHRIGCDQWGWSADPAFLHNFVAMVLHAGTTKGIRSPAASLKSLMKKRDWRKIPDSCDDRAKQILAAHRPPPAPIVVKSFGGIEPEHDAAARQAKHREDMQQLAALDRQRQKVTT